MVALESFVFQMDSEPKEPDKVVAGFSMGLELAKKIYASLPYDEAEKCVIDILGAVGGKSKR